MRGRHSTTFRRFAAVLATLLPLVSGATVSAGTLGIVSAMDAEHRVALRPCENAGLDLVVAHHDDSLTHERHEGLAFEVDRSDASTTHPDHLVRCAVGDSGATRISLGSSPPASLPAAYAIAQNPLRVRPGAISTRTRSASLAALRIVVLRN